MPRTPRDLTGKVIVITGAARGIGAATARALAREGAVLAIGDLDGDLAGAVAAELGGNAIGRALDVTDHLAFAAFLDRVEDELGPLDVLINNAGIAGTEARRRNGIVPGAADTTADGMREVFETNVFGLVRVTRAFLPLLQRSAAPVIVNLSSGLASLTLVTTPDTPTKAYPGVSYPASKAAVNMVTVQFAKQFPDIRINAVEPGYTATDLNGKTGHQSVEEGVELILRMAQIGPDGPTGAVFDARGLVAW